MNFIKFIIVALILNSCTSNKSIIGLYGKCAQSYYTCNQLELKSDSTFEYYTFRDVGGASKLKGKWEQISAETIILNTDYQPKVSTTNYLGRHDPTRPNNIKIWISNADSPLASAIISINGEKLQKATNNNGLVEFEASQIQSISYQFLDKNETIAITDSNYNEIFITTKDLNQDSYLQNEIISIKNRKLIFKGISLTKTRSKYKAK